MPETVQVGPIRFRVSTDLDELRDAEERMNCGLDGVTSPHLGLIQVNPRHVPDYQRSTVVHEVIHAVLKVCAGAQLPDEIEEAVCRHLEGGLLGVLRDNPDLVAWLTAKE